MRYTLSPVAEQLIVALLFGGAMFLFGFSLAIWLANWALNHPSAI